MNYCSLDLFNFEVQDVRKQLLEADSKESLIEMIGGSSESILGSGYWTDSGEFHPYTKEDVITLLNNLKEDPQKKLTKKAIEDVIRNYNSEFAKTPSKVLSGYNLDETGQLTTILSPELNNALQKDLNAEMNSLLVYNKSAHYIPVGEVGLNQAIKTYKNQLFTVLVNFVQEKLSPEDYDRLLEFSLYDVNGDTVLLKDDYARVLELAKEKIESALRNRTSGNKFNEMLTASTRNNILNPIKALYVLNDFDKFIEKFSCGQIGINKDLVDKLEVFDKYVNKARALRQKDFKDSKKSVDASNEISGKFFRFFETIPDGKGGYLTKNDFNSIRKHVENFINDTKYIGPLTALVKPISVEEKFRSLIKALKEDAILRKRIGEDVCDNLVDYLTSYKTDYVTLLTSPNTSVSDAKVLEHHYNFCAQIIWEMTNANNSAHQSVTSEGNKIETASRVTKGKATINTDVANHISDAFSNGDYYLFNPKFILPGSSEKISDYTNVYSDEYINYVRKLTGIDLMTDSIRQKLSTTDGALKLAKFINAINNKVKTDLYPFKDANAVKFKAELDKVMSSLKQNNTDYIAFTTFLIEDNLNDQPILYGQNQEILPSSSVKNTVSNFAQNWEDFKQQFGEENGNAFSQFSGLSTPSREWYENYSDRIIYRHDYQMGAMLGEARSLVSAESATVALNYDFIDSIVKDNVFLNQIECVSDKPRIPLGAFNVMGEKNGKPLLWMTYDEIVDCYKEQHSKYYLKVESNLISDYSLIFGKSFDSLESAIKELESHSYNDLFKKVYDYNKDKSSSDQIQLTNQIHYVPGKSLNDKLKFNNALYLNIKAAREGNQDILDKLLKQGFDNTFEFLEENNIPVLVDFNSNKLQTYRYLCDDMGVGEKDLAGFFAHNSSWIKYNPGFNPKNATTQDKINNLTKLSRNFLKKFFILQQFATEADLQLTVKDPIIHTSGTTLSVNELQQINGSNLFDSRFDSVFKELSVRMVKGKKRNNALVASFQSMMQGLDYGVGRKMNIAFIESPKRALLNFNGDEKGDQNIRDGQDIHDGGGLTNPIFNVLELHSYIGRDFHDTKKAIGLFNNSSSFTQIKYADFTLTNAMMRDSFKKPNYSDDFDAYKIMQKMNNYDATPIAEGYKSAEQHKAFDKNIYLVIDGKLHQIEDINFTDLTVTWRNVDDGTISPPKSMRDKNGNFTVFSLWEALGGCYCKSFKDGILDWSEKSNERVADLISLYASKLKEVITAKLVDKSAAKSCDVNINPVGTLYDENYPTFAHYIADTSRMGIQQDYSHESDESQIPALTQVLTALAFNGENIDLVNDIYETLGDILDESLRPLRNLLSKPDKHDFNKYVAEKLLRSLEKSGVQSNATSIVKEALEKIYKDLSGKESIPYSSRQLFSKVASDFISGLNNDSLRQKFSGIAIVQNPSHGIIGVYEDKYGNKYTGTTLADFAYEIGYTGDSEGAIDFALSQDIFQSTDADIIPIERLSIGDSYELISDSEISGPVESVEGKVHHIDSPKDLIKLKENGVKQVRKTYKGQRDLRACNITFRDAEGSLQNLWLLDSTLKKIDSPKDKLVTLYYKANLRGIGEKTNPFYFKTEEDFELFMQKGGFDKPANNAGKTFIIPDTVEYTPGEQIIPKVNKTAQGLDASLNYIKRHPDYFVEKVRQDLTNVSHLRADSSDTFVVTLTNNSKEIVYTTNEPSSKAYRVKGKNEGDSIWMYNSIGEKVVELPIENVYIDEFNKDGKQVIVVYLPQDVDLKILQETIRKTKDVSAYYFDGENKFNTLKRLTNYLNDFDVSPKAFDKTVEEQSKKLFNSFQLSNLTISARIPSQSFQSFMANETIEFMPGDSNDGYVNLWQIWFQGSKLV